MVGWYDEHGNIQGGFPNKIAPVRGQYDPKFKKIIKDIQVEKPTPFAPELKIPEPEVKDHE